MNKEIGLFLVLALGFLNLVGLSVLFLSCRCMGGRKLADPLFQKAWFQRFYRHHCYYWGFLWLSVVSHAVLAFLVVGLPF